MTQNNHAEGHDEKRPPPTQEGPDAFRRFAELAKRLVRVPKSEMPRDKLKASDG